MTTRPFVNGEFKQALETFETTLETPHIPGELVLWMDSVREACLVATAAVRQKAANEHPVLLKRITAEDPELATRVENMREEDVALVERCDELERQSHSLVEMIPQFEPDEHKLEEHIQAFIKDGLDFIIATRKQEAALDTWYQESLYRDRGDV